MLEIKKLFAEYEEKGMPQEIIRNLSFSLPENGVLAVVGPSGCGKTTLLNTLAGIFTPQKGEVLFHNQPLSPTTTVIGLIPQNYGLLPWKTVMENCLFSVGNQKAKEGTAREYLASLGIAELENRYPREISGGQAQRVALTRAFLMEPELVLMDEPFAALDFAAAHTAKELTFQIWETHKSTTVIVTHRLEEAFYLGTRLAVMGSGGNFVYEMENRWQGKDGKEELEYYRELGQIQEIILRESVKAVKIRKD